MTISDDEALKVIRAGVDLLHKDGDIVELRVLRNRDDKYSANTSGFFNSIEKLARAILIMNKRRKTVFTTMNPLKPGWMAVNNKAYVGSTSLRQELEKAGQPLTPRMKAGTNWDSGESYFSMRMAEDEDVLCRRWVLIDLDAGQSANENSSDEEHDAALFLAEAVIQFLKEKDFPPLGFIDSGNGFHLYLRLPDLENTPKSTLLIRRFLLSLAQRFDGQFGKAHVDTGMWTGCRITKAGGTIAYKAPTETPERPYRRSEVIQSVGPRFATEEQIAEIASEYTGNITAWDGGEGVAIDDAELRAQVNKLTAFLDFYGIEHGGAQQSETHIVIPCTCPQIDLHTMDGGELETVASVNLSGAFGFCCQHAHCQELRSWAGLKKFVESRDGKIFSFDPEVTFSE
jgi:hypothetical protein